MHYQEEVRSVIEEMIKNTAIKPSQSAWMVLIVITPVNTTEKSVTKGNSFPVRVMDDLDVLFG